MTTKLDRWHWKTTGHISYASFSFMDHFLVISEFNFELQSGNAQIRLILAIFCLLWPWNFTDDLQKQKGISFMSFQALCIISLPSVNSNFSYSLESFKSGRIWRFFCPIWPWNFTDDLENQQGTSSIPIQALCIISYSISQEICTRFLLCCALLWLYIDWFSHIHQAYFTGTVAI